MKLIQRLHEMLEPAFYSSPPTSPQFRRKSEQLNPHKKNIIKWKFVNLGDFNIHQTKLKAKAQNA
jgi:hypothetical protein